MVRQSYPYIKYSAAVKSALTDNKPVLALESTVITHGLPYPQNLEIARKLEQIAVDNGVTPATIAVIDGCINIGLDETGFDRLAELSNQSQKEQGLHIKIALRDISMVIAKNLSGGATVSATIFCSYLAGIKVFATGGIGGVHRHWQESFDISADLSALASYPVIVVTAGCKAILDIPATLEQLETNSVPVYGWQTNHCPAFYSRESQYLVERIDAVEDIVKAYKISNEFRDSDNNNGKGSGLVVMNPIPEEYNIPSNYIEPIITQAIYEAEQLGIKGKALTPWLLQRLSDATEGKSVEANLELLKNNVKLGSMIAKSFSKE